MLNKCMKNKQNLEKLYLDVKALGFVANQWDFSIMCGRTPAWFSSIKAQGLPLTTDAALTLSSNIRSRASKASDAVIRSGAVKLSERLLEEAQWQINAKLLRHSGCSS